MTETVCVPSWMPYAFTGVWALSCLVLRWAAQRRGYAEGVAEGLRRSRRF